MEKLSARREAVKKALACFEEAVQDFQNKDNPCMKPAMIRDALIQRFEFSIDTFWKFLMLYMTDELRVVIDQASPKQVFQRAIELKLLTPQEYGLCIDMSDDRNMTSHTYNETLAKKISNKLPQYFDVLSAIFKRLEH